MREFLFIGGAQDGKRRDWDVGSKDPYLRVPSRYSDDGYVETELYRLEKIYSGQEVFCFFVLNSLTAQEAIAKLIEGYNP